MSVLGGDLKVLCLFFYRSRDTANLGKSKLKGYTKTMSWPTNTLYGRSGSVYPCGMTKAKAKRCCIQACFLQHVGCALQLQHTKVNPKRLLIIVTSPRLVPQDQYS